MKKGNKRRPLIGVTLALVVLAVISAGLLFARKHREEARESVCLSNREQIIVLYQLVLVDERPNEHKVTMQKVLDGKYPLCADKIGPLGCPAGGIYSYDDARHMLVCSLHGALSLPDERPDGTTPHYLPATRIPIVPSYWPDSSLDTVYPGGVFQFGDDYYIVLQQMILYGDETMRASPANYLSDSEYVVRLTGLVASASTINPTPMALGDVYLDSKGDYYLARYTGELSLPPSQFEAMWFKLPNYN